MFFNINSGIHEDIAAAGMVVDRRAELFELAPQAADIGVDHALVAAGLGAVPHLAEDFDAREMAVAVLEEHGKDGILRGREIEGRPWRVAVRVVKLTLSGPTLHIAAEPAAGMGLRLRITARTRAIISRREKGLAM